MKKQIALLGALAIGLANIAAITPQDETTTVKNQRTSKEGLNKTNAPVRSVATRNIHGGFSGESFRSAANRFLNQRQYRKRCRQNPWMYNSKKHRSKK